MHWTEYLGATHEKDSYPPIPRGTLRGEIVTRKEPMGWLLDVNVTYDQGYIKAFLERQFGHLVDGRTIDDIQILLEEAIAANDSAQDCNSEKELELKSIIEIDWQHFHAKYPDKAFDLIPNIELTNPGNTCYKLYVVDTVAYSVKLDSEYFHEWLDGLVAALGCDNLQDMIAQLVVGAM